MNHTKRYSRRLLAAAINLTLITSSAVAANVAWTGGGTDDNWGTAGNWSAAIPVNGDNLTFSGTARQNSTNNLGSLTAGWVQFSDPGFVLKGNALALTTADAGIITNLAGTNIIGTDLLSIVQAGKRWYVAPNSEVRLTGPVTNLVTASGSVGFLMLDGGGTVRFMSNCLTVRAMDFSNAAGTVIVDGGYLDHSTDGLRFRPGAGSTAGTRIVNNGTWRIGGGGNVRLGNGGAASGSFSRMSVESGLLELYGANTTIFVSETAGANSVFNLNGGLIRGLGGNNDVVLGNGASADGTFYLNGGVAEVHRVRQGNAGATTAIFNFNGGTLRPTMSLSNFMEGIQAVNIQNGGAIIDTANFNITINQYLAGTGGLTKLGDGTLTLGGANNYSGATVVGGGTLALGANALSGGGPITVSNGATLNMTSEGYSSTTASFLSMGNGGSSALTIHHPYGTLYVPALVLGSLNGSGTVAINITGQNFVAGRFSLVQFGSATGLASFQLGSVPPGVSATLIKTATALDLNISSVVKSLAWSGAVDNQWNTSTMNWYDVGAGNVAASYAQSGGFGDMVTFDDSASGSKAINIPIPVVPVSMTVNNNSYNYTFSGAGRISGVGTLTKDGGATLTINTANDFTGGTRLNYGQINVGSDQALGTGELILNTGTLASDGTTARTVGNAVTFINDFGVNLGDLVNTGTLNLSGPVSLGGGNARVLTLNNDVILGGTLTNGGLASKFGPGRLIITGQGRLAGLMTHNEGDVIINGGRLDCADGWRMQSTVPGAALRFAVTNGGIYTMTTGTGNFRVGYSGGEPSANNILDIAGTVSLYAPTDAGGRLDLGQSGASDIVNLRSGGVLQCRGITCTAPANTEFHLYGGTLMPAADSTAFMQGITNAWVHDGGVTVDTTNFNITIAQPLLASGTGGLTKTGPGTLTLSGANTYTGVTRVNEGRLVLGMAHAAPGNITVASNAILSFLSSTPGETVVIPSATNGAGSRLEAQFIGNTGNPTAPAGFINNLVVNGTVLVNLVGAGITAGEFPLLGYNTLGGTGSLVVGQLPQGLAGTLVTNTSAKTINLVVGSVVPVDWTGAVDGNWNLTATNWTVGGAPTLFRQSDGVRFGDAASNPALSLAQTLTPGSVLVSNTALAYSFSGPGSLGGAMALTKQGANTLALNTANTFLGMVTVEGGTVIAGNASALGATNGATVVAEGGTLDVNGQNLGFESVIVGGSGAGGLGALINSGAAQNNALLDVTLAGDTVIRADDQLGIRMPNETDPGFDGNGFKLTKIGAGTLALNGGQGNLGGATVWDCDLGDAEVLEGTLSFQRRMTMGRTSGTITVQAGGNLELYALNSAVVPLQTKPIHLNGGTLGGTGSSAAEGNSFGGPITLATGTNYIRAMVGTTLQLFGPVSGSGSLFLNSGAAATVSLAGTNTHTGRTVVQSGTLALQFTGSIANSSNITVQSGATLDVSATAPWTLGAGQTLGGGGTVNGSVVTSGTVAPGEPIGTLTFNSDLQLAGTCLMELTKDGGLASDQVSVAGTLTFGGQLKVVVNGGTPLAVNDTFKLFNFTGTPSGSFALNLPSGYTWDATQLPVDGTLKVTGVIISNPPVIGKVTVSGANLTMTGTGGSAGGTFYVLSSTNVALPVSTWTPVLTNSFAANGSFTNVLPVLPGESKRFYLLSLP